MKKLALSVAAVVAVVGAIYVLPSALPSSSPDVADRASTVALTANPTTTTTSESAAVVTVPGLGGPSNVATSAQHHSAKAAGPSTRPSPTTTPAPPAVAYTTVSAPPAVSQPREPTTSVARPVQPQSASTTPSAAAARKPGTPTDPTTVDPTTAVPTTAAEIPPPPSARATVAAKPKPIITVAAKPKPIVTVAAKPKPVTVVTKPKAAVKVAPKPRPVVRAPVKPKPVARKPVPAPNFGIPVTTGNATQIITVRASSASSTTGTLIAWQKQSTGRWAVKFGPVTAHLGSEGVGSPSEYHSRTPRGTYGLTEAFGRDSNPGTSLPYSHVTTRDWWVSDVNSSKYNSHQICSAGSCPFNTGAGENLYNAGAVYDYAVVMDVNRWPATPGDGSAFFLHVTDGGSTAGCVAINAATLVSIMRWLKPSGHPRIAVGIG